MLSRERKKKSTCLTVSNNNNNNLVVRKAVYFLFARETHFTQEMRKRKKKIRVEASKISGRPGFLYLWRARFS